MHGFSSYSIKQFNNGALGPETSPTAAPSAAAILLYNSMCKSMRLVEDVSKRPSRRHWLAFRRRKGHPVLPLPRSYAVREEQ
jgi:hypothetical protein